MGLAHDAKIDLGKKKISVNDGRSPHSAFQYGEHDKSIIQYRCATAVSSRWAENRVLS